MIEQWLKDHLIAGGHMTPSGQLRRAVVRPCARCGEWIFHGLDADVCAREARADTFGLNELGELVALSAGLDTYSLRHTRGRYELDWRDEDDIRAHPAGRTAGVDVLPAHRCGVSIQERAPTRISQRMPRKIENYDNPPF